MDNEADYEKLDSRIEELIRKRWEERRPLLLSQLGSQDDGEVAKVAKSKMGSLSAYLRTRLPTKVKILQHSTMTVIIGVVPADANIPEADIDRLLEETIGSGGRRYHAAFWAAFRKPLEPSLRRYLHVKRPPHFKDTGSEETVGAGYTEIDRTFIASLDADNAKVEESIRGWLESTEIEAQTFYQNQSARETTLPHDDLLGRLLTTLNADDLRRMTIPLDVVEKLRRTTL